MGRQRFWRRALCVATGAPLVICATFLAYARVGTDPFFLQHWQHAEPVVETRTHALSFRPHCLSAEERQCLRAWVDAASLSSPPSAERFSPQFVLQDTLCFLCGSREWADVLRLVARLPVARVAPYLMAIRRETQGDVVFLHGKVETEVTLRIPFGAGAVWKCVFPSVVSLQLEPVGSGWFCVRRPYRIAAAEHRWFGGPLASFQSTSLRSPWGDIGDILRRLNGYAASCVVAAADDAISHISGLFSSRTQLKP